MVSHLWSVSVATIKATEVVSGRYTRKPIPGFSRLVGYTLAGVFCKGKLIAMDLQPPDGSLSPQLYALSTLGMTGEWVVATLTRGRSLRPKHVRLAIKLHDVELQLHDSRNFGTFKLVSKAGLSKKLAELGPDIAKHDLAPPELFDRLARYAKKKTIAEAMLDQRIFCGVGNYMRADALYNAQIDPRVPALDLSRQQLGQLWADSHIVANRAYFEPSYQSPCYGRRADAFGSPIESYQDSGNRTVWWCPTIQAA
jgi:formamidopyrimidine-DNA glycosylase